MNKPLVLIILDGWGYREEIKDNGIAQARIPFFKKIWENYPHTLIEASGPAVGLPQGIMGNSEVGHMNLGAGRVVYSGLSQIYHSIETGDFFKNPALLSAIRAAKQNNSRLHLIGLVSDGAVHSHQDHLYALLELAKRENLDQVFIHAITDGRDTSPRDALGFVEALEKKCATLGVGRVASVSGRFYAMDRDKRWERVEKAYEAFVGTSPNPASSALQIVRESYQNDQGDEFIIPRFISDSKNQPVGALKEGDAVIFFNFRSDRAREITRVLTESSFSEFERKNFPKLSTYVCLAEYDATFNLPVAFKANYPQMTLGEVLGEKGLKQLRIAETEKYAHVTFFFNGGQEKNFPGEERILIPSPREVATYDLKPEMAAEKITNAVLEQIEKDTFDVIVINFANSDMVGHTAVAPAIIQSVETVDHCLEKIISTVVAKQGCVLVTADHGNAEQMKDGQGRPHTAHTTNPVPLIVAAPQAISLKQHGGRLCDVAPTILQLLGITQPQEMTGESLLTS